MATHVLIVGGGYVGMYTALRLHKKMRRELKSGELQITVVDPQSYMTYQPFLPEAAAGNVEARHVVVPLRRVLPRATILNGRVTKVEHAKRQAWVEVVGSTSAEGGGGERSVETRMLSYDLLVFCPGSISRTLPIPGLAQCGIGFKTVGEAIYLRNHVLAQLDIAASTANEKVRKRALTFVFVGGGYAGVEALAELEDMARDACAYYPNVDPSDMRWVLVEASDRILPEVGPDMGRWTVETLRRRGIAVKLQTLLKSAEGHHIVLSDGEEFDAGTLVWTAGVKPNPVVRRTDLPLDEKGRLKATAELTVEGVEGAFTAGDIAAVPDLTKPGNLTAPNAQHAVRQAKVLGDNVVAALRGKELKRYEHAYAGSVASLGLRKGVAQIYGVKLRGIVAWWLHRTYHLSRVPTVNRKARVTADWTLAVFFKREIVSLGSITRPREEFELAAKD
ncbi:NAD(P)/FAD-dependent oxidoreductase [Actinoallomurus rhizosphaericola]|uniref:NAD(P)/FAD-dependent oxidoreductase n=1 Tax=Actinoallomurus rhizosphaericola TaxID=2952536 RepID=UPI0020910B05|nr:NAD(P)/FAD-dependent oxidoreductase [Actinoallomurus rhizosphaericola]MCO5992763.1 NAD(P)/FAD-dependent oxidoreductase [Actinoallomurus rhizosphaericola]